MARDFDENPYSKDEQRVADYIVEASKGNIGGGDDPIGYLMAAHAHFSDLVKSLRERGIV